MKRVIVVTLFLFVVITASSVFAQTPSFKVAWKQGIILGLLVPPNTTKEQLKDLIYKFRQARKEKTLSALIPPVNLGLPDKYTGFMIFIFSDPNGQLLKNIKNMKLPVQQLPRAGQYPRHIQITSWHIMNMNFKMAKNMVRWGLMIMGTNQCIIKSYFDGGFWRHPLKY